jgi:hypothetical protein
MKLSALALSYGFPRRLIYPAMPLAARIGPSLFQQRSALAANVDGSANAAQPLAIR